MAKQIRPTPRLDEKQTEKFLTIVENDLAKPVGEKCDPKRLEAARKKAIARATERKKLRS